MQSQLDTKLNKNADIDMKNHKIKNLGTPLTHENDAAVNVAFSNKEMNDSNTNLYTRLTKDYNTYVNKSHIISPQKKDSFRYLMEDADESSSENNISVLGHQCFGHQRFSRVSTSNKQKSLRYPNRVRERLSEPVPVTPQF